MVKFSKEWKGSKKRSPNSVNFLLSVSLNLAPARTKENVQKFHLSIAKYP